MSASFPRRKGGQPLTHGVRSLDLQVRLLHEEAQDWSRGRITVQARRQKRLWHFEAEQRRLGRHWRDRLDPDGCPSVVREQ